jgi:hypothetical protein
VASRVRLAGDYGRALPGLEGVRAQLRRLRAGLRDQPELARVLRPRGAEFRLGERKTLARVRKQLREKAKKEAARERAEAERRPRRSRGLGTSR